MSAQGISSLPAVYARLISEGYCESQKNNKQNEWIWEYVLKNCKDFQMTTLLLEAVPIPDTPLIKKLALLKLLSLDEAAGSVSDRDLYALQGFEDLLREERRKERFDATAADDDEQVDAMDDVLPKLQLFVKAELALQHLRDGKDDFGSFSDAVERHWGEMVQDTLEPDSSDLVEEIRKNIKSDLWSLKMNLRLKRFVLEEYTRERLDDLLKKFLDLAWREIGPVFLEKAEDDILNGRYVPSGEKRFSSHDPVSDRKNKKVRKTLLPSLNDRPQQRQPNDRDSPRNNPPPWTAEASTQEKRKLRRICAEEEPAAAQNPQVERVLQELKQSQLDLKQQVTDPLPEAVEVARNLKKGNASHPTGGDDKEAEAEIDQQGKGRLDQNGNKSKISFLERNSTARICEWDEADEIEENSREASPSASKRLNLPSTSTKKVSPLRKTDLKASQRRRKFTRWTTREEEALRKGIDEYGKGRWKAILQSNMDVFENRTEVDLKDKWRNIEKAEGIKRV